MIGIPVFAPGNAATAGAWDLHFVLPWRGNDYLPWDASNGGYVVGFIIAAALVGYLAERRWDRGPWVQVAMLAGNLAVYSTGLLWLGYLIATDWVAPGGTKPISELIAGSGTLDKTLKGGLYPFIVGDLMKLLLAAMVLPGAWAIVTRCAVPLPSRRGDSQRVRSYQTWPGLETKLRGFSPQYPQFIRANL